MKYKVQDKLLRINEVEIYHEVANLKTALEFVALQSVYSIVFIVGTRKFGRSWLIYGPFSANLKIAQNCAKEATPVIFTLDCTLTNSHMQNSRLPKFDQT